MFYMPPKTFVAGLVLGLALFALFTAIGIYVTVNLPVALNPPLVLYSGIVAPEDATLCPGDTYGISAWVHVTRPGLSQTFTSIRDTETGRSVPDAQRQTGVRIQPAEVQFMDTYTFTVPDVAPGNYEYLRSTIAINMDAEPSFLVIPFAVGECP